MELDSLQNREVFRGLHLTIKAPVTQATNMLRCENLHLDGVRVSIAFGLRVVRRHLAASARGRASSIICDEFGRLQVELCKEIAVVRYV
jgi:hypothetical protein